MAQQPTLPDIYQTFSGKNLFITGGSGFLGKVLLYKILKEFPDCGTITVLMRAKKGKKPLERINDDVLSSACFDGLKSDLGAEEWKRRTSKIRVATGDVLNDQLGLNQEDSKFLCETTHIILHLAATVNFQEKLPVSVQMNVLGSLRVLALAKKCPQLEAMIHTSTCYVNYGRHGRNLIKEQIYPLPFDPEQMCRLILGLHESEVPRQTAMLLKKYGFPNTYTFTKHMAECLMQRMKGTVPITIVRPAIVGCSLREPYPGWVDVLTAAGGLFLTVGLGVCHDLHGKADMIADIVPVDYVVNTLLKAAYKTSVQHRMGTIRLMISPSSIDQPNNSSTATPLLEKNIRSITVSKSSPSSFLSSGNRQNNSTSDAAVSTLESLKISTSAESTSGLIRPTTSSSVNNNSSAKNHNNNTNSSNALKALEGGAAASEGAGSSSSSTDSNDRNGALPFVFQSATSSSLNPLTWRTSRDVIVDYFKAYPAPRTIDRPYIHLHDTKLAFELSFFFKRKLPYYAMQVAAQIPGAMTEKQKGLLVKYARVLHRVADFNFQFQPFTTVEWRYDCKNSSKYLDDGMVGKARQAFATDLYDINWKQYCEAYAYGLVRYFMKVKDARPLPQLPGSSSDKFMRSML